LLVIALISGISNSSNAALIILDEDSKAYPKPSNSGKIPNPISIPSSPSLS
jgi:hypothetical protein